MVCRTKTRIVHGNTGVSTRSASSPVAANRVADVAELKETESGNGTASCVKPIHQSLRPASVIGARLRSPLSTRTTLTGFVHWSARTRGSAPTGETRSRRPASRLRAGGSARSLGRAVVVVPRRLISITLFRVASLVTYPMIFAMGCRSARGVIRAGIMAIPFVVRFSRLRSGSV